MQIPKKKKKEKNNNNNKDQNLKKISGGKESYRGSSLTKKKRKTNTILYRFICCFSGTRNYNCGSLVLSLCVILLYGIVICLERLRLPNTFLFFFFFSSPFTQFSFQSESWHQFFIPTVSNSFHSSTFIH